MCKVITSETCKAKRGNLKSDCLSLIIELIYFLNIFYILIQQIYSSQFYFLLHAKQQIIMLVKVLNFNKKRSKLL